MFHVPLRGVLEWATIEDSGRLLSRVCDSTVPEEFWCNFYNIGSGPEYRLTNYEFEQIVLKAVSCPKPEKIFEPKWFVLRNFHGQWYLDSDRLENYLHFRANMPLDEYIEKHVRSHVPWYYRLAVLCPPFIIKAVMRMVANTRRWGTQWWIKNNDQQRIAAYYGSKEAYDAIPGWDKVDLSRPSDVPSTLIKHGYDESKPRQEWTLEDMQEAAQFRGGKCLSTSMEKGDFRTPLLWECADGHQFKASPALVLLGGHWCPECSVPTPEHMVWDYNRIAKVNPFFGQVWTPLHGTEETDSYDEHIFDGWE